MLPKSVYEAHQTSQFDSTLTCSIPAMIAPPAPRIKLTHLDELEAESNIMREVAAQFSQAGNALFNR